MKRIAAISLLTCLFFTIIGYHFLFHVEIWEAKMEMKKHINILPDRNTITELSFDSLEAKQIEWENEDEFSWKGEMYDVIAKTTQGNHTIIQCIADKKETELVDQYIKVSQKNSSENQPSSSLVKLITAPFLQSRFSEPIQPEKKLNKDFTVYSTLIISHNSSVLAPPPKVA